MIIPSRFLNCTKHERKSAILQYGSNYPGFAIVITIMISDLGHIDLDIIEQSCAVNNEDRIVTDVFVVPFDVSPEVCPVDFFSTKCFKNNTKPKKYSSALGYNMLAMLPARF